MSDGHKHAILLVDDQVDSREGLALVLKLEGFDVRVAANGQEALAALHEGLQPCVIVLDLMMPLMDGWQFRQRQLWVPKFAGIPVVVMSGYDGLPTATHGMNVEDVIEKPIDVPRLVEMVRAQCRA